MLKHCLTALLLTVAASSSTFADPALAENDVPHVLLRIDVSDPAKVTFSATGAFSLINDSSGGGGNGVQLLDFFTSNFPNHQSGGLVLGTLTPAGGKDVYESWTNDFGTIPGTAINIYGSIFAEFQVFSDSSPAFSGVSTIDLTDLPLPASCSLGNIVVGDTAGGSGATIGQWIAVPEPSTLICGLVSCIVGYGVLAKRIA